MDKELQYLRSFFFFAWKAYGVDYLRRSHLYDLSNRLEGLGEFYKEQHAEHGCGVAGTFISVGSDDQRPQCNICNEYTNDVEAVNRE